MNGSKVCWDSRFCEVPQGTQIAGSAFVGSNYTFQLASLIFFDLLSICVLHLIWHISLPLRTSHLVFLEALGTDERH